MKCLLAPVPIIHVTSATDVFKVSPVVAFATDKFEFFSTDGAPKLGDPVFVVASATGLETGQLPPFKIGHAVYSAKFAGYRAAVRGRHPIAETRPVSTFADHSVSGFFELSELEVITPIPASRFKTAQGKPFAQVPRGPVWARLSEDGAA